jgi:hypothetical protein
MKNSFGKSLELLLTNMCTPWTYCEGSKGYILPAVRTEAFVMPAAIATTPPKCLQAHATLRIVKSLFVYPRTPPDHRSCHHSTSPTSCSEPGWACLLLLLLLLLLALLPLLLLVQLCPACLLPRVPTPQCLQPCLRPQQQHLQLGTVVWQRTWLHQGDLLPGALAAVAQRM